MPEEIVYTINEFEQEVIVLNTVTILRLFKLSSDATLLYLFYIKNAKTQKTNTVYSTDNFCVRGLGWGKTKFNKAKRILIDNNFIEPIAKRDESGRIIKHYIKIHYLKNNNNFYPGVSKTTSGYQTTNAVNKKLNAINKETEIFTNVNISSDVGEILDYYNKSVDKIRYILKENNINLKKMIPTRHKSVYSKCTVSLPLDKLKAKALPLHEIIKEYLDSEPKETLFKAIDNHTEIFISNALGKNEYFYIVVWKSLGQFIYSGLKNNTGYKSLLDLNKLKRGYKNNLSVVDKIRSDFKPVTKIWDESKILDKNRNTYYGFITKELRGGDVIKSDIEDILDFNAKDAVLPLYGYFEKLERAICSLLFNRKSFGIDLGVITRLMLIWNVEQKRWRKIANKLRE